MSNILDQNSVNLILPWPPSVNHYKTVGRIITTRNGKIYQQRKDTNETKYFYFAVSQEIKIQNLRHYFNAEQRLQLTLYAYPPDSRKRDLDGILKVLLDSLQRGFLYPDDYQIDRLIVERRNVFENGRVEVVCSEILDECF